MLANPHTVLTFIDNNGALKARCSCGYTMKGHGMITGHVVLFRGTIPPTHAARVAQYEAADKRR